MEKVGEEKDHGAPSTPTPGKQLKLWQTAPEALETKPLTPPRTPGRRSGEMCVVLFSVNYRFEKINSPEMLNIFPLS